MNSKPVLCVCGHWSYDHHEVFDEETDASYWKCSKCADCGDLEPDEKEMKEREDEAKVLRDDVRRGK